MVKLYDPLENSVSAKAPRSNDTNDVKAFSVAPKSPRSDKMMKKSLILIQGKQIPVWADLDTNIVFPYMKD